MRLVSLPVIDNRGCPYESVVGSSKSFSTLSFNGAPTNILFVMVGCWNEFVERIFIFLFDNNKTNYNYLLGERDENG